MGLMDQEALFYFFRLGPIRNPLFHTANKVKKQVIAAATTIVTKARSRTT